MKRNYLIYALLMTVFLSSNVISAQNYFGDFPVKADPKTVGNKLSRRLMETKHQLYFDRGIHYAEVIRLIIENFVSITVLDAPDG